MLTKKKKGFEEGVWSKGERTFICQTYFQFSKHWTQVSKLNARFQRVIFTPICSNRFRGSASWCVLGSSPVNRKGGSRLLALALWLPCKCCSHCSSFTRRLERLACLWGTLSCYTGSSSATWLTMRGERVWHQMWLEIWTRNLPNALSSLPCGPT